MFTTCPKCSLKLVVTAADLRVAQGYVRCGRCSNVFNALAGLSDEQQAVLSRETARPQREPPSSQKAGAPAPTAPQPSAPDGPSGGTRPPRPAEEPLTDEALEFDPTSTDVSELFIEPTEDDPTGTFESIVLRSEDVAERTWGDTEEGEALPAPDRQPRASSEPREMGALEQSETHELEIDLEALVAVTLPPPRTEAPGEPDAAPRDSAARETAPPGGAAPAATPEPPAPAPEPRPAIAPSEPRVAPEPRPGTLAADLGPLARERMTHGEQESGAGTRIDRDRALKIGSAALAVLLLLQIVNHERSELAGLSWLRAPLTTVYSALGMPLAPHWNVRAYEVRQLGADASSPGALTVRASVRNTAPRDQPLPLLRVTMQDRFGNRIAARDVPPSAYLPAGGSGHADLPAGQRVDAEIAFVDPGPSAVGFEIDACLELAGGRIACANDAVTER